MPIVRSSDCVPLPIVVCPVVAVVMLESRVGKMCALCGEGCQTAVRSPPAYFTAVCRVTIPEAVVIQLVLLMMISVLLETC